MSTWSIERKRGGTTSAYLASLFLIGSTVEGGEGLSLSEIGDSGGVLSRHPPLDLEQNDNDYYDLVMD